MDERGDRFPVGGSEAVVGASPTAEQAELIRTLRAAVVDSPEFRAHEAEACAYISDDRLLHRFLRARKYSLPKAGEMLRRHLTWRFATYRPFDIRCAEMEPYARTGSIQASFEPSLPSVTSPTTMKPCVMQGTRAGSFARGLTAACQQVSPNGVDQWQRPVVILDDSKECIVEPDARRRQRAAMRHLAFSLERASRQMGNDVEKLVVFICLQDFSLWTAPSAATTRETIDMVCNQVSRESNKAGSACTHPASNEGTHVLAE